MAFIANKTVAATEMNATFRSKYEFQEVDLLYGLCDEPGRSAHNTERSALVNYEEMPYFTNFSLSMWRDVAVLTNCRPVDTKTLV